MMQGITEGWEAWSESAFKVERGRVVEVTTIIGIIGEGILFLLHLCTLAKKNREFCCENNWNYDLKHWR